MLFCMCMRFITRLENLWCVRPVCACNCTPNIESTECMVLYIYCTYVINLRVEFITCLADLWHVRARAITCLILRALLYIHPYPILIFFVITVPTVFTAITCTIVEMAPLYISSIYIYMYIYNVDINNSIMCSKFTL